MTTRITKITVLFARQRLTACFAVLLLALCAQHSLAQETERPVKMKDLPSAAQATVREQSKGATLRGLSMETKDGQTFYEASLRVNGRLKDVLMDANGAVVEVEEQVTLASLPPAARAEVVKQAGKGRILLIESIKKNNAIVAYEAHVRTAGKISEIKVDPDGKPLPN